MSGVELTGAGKERRGEEQRERRRAHLLAAARSVFASRGYHRTHVADVIEAAGVARGTFYLYFDGKSAIFMELLDNLLAEFRAEIVGVDTKAGHAPLPTQLTAILTKIFKVAETNRPLITIIMREAVGLDAAVEAKLSAFYAEIHAYVVKALRQGARLGLLREVDADVAALGLVGGIKHLMERQVAEPPVSVPTERMVQGFLDYHLRALVP